MEKTWLKICLLLANPFFNQDSAALSEQQLSFLLQEEGYQDVAFAHGTVQAILAGNLLYNCPGRPSNFSIFNFYEKLKDGSENANTVLVHIMSKDGKTRSKEEIKQIYETSDSGT